MAGGTGLRVQDFLLEVVKGNVAGHYGVSKFGRNIEIDAAVIADLWDGGHTLASGGVSLKWVAPTAARIHTIVSSDVGDDAAGVGAKTIRVHYLPDWDTKETTEDIIMDGTTGVAMANAAVIINRMEVLTKGATNVNIGIIKATAAVDSTISAQIQAGKGQTNQAILGIPSTQKFYMFDLYGYLNKAVGATGLIDMDLLVNPEPSTELLNFLSKHPFGLQTVGTSGNNQPFPVPKMICGNSDGVIVKLQVLSGSANADISGGFTGVLVDNNIGAL